ncbi:MAG: hypothetical protein JNL82_08945 [Myxococcales bacterium]|nr:hypothetical protein [Myxococcales bacterium]
MRPCLSRVLSCIALLAPACSGVDGDHESTTLPGSGSSDPPHATHAADHGDSADPTPPAPDESSSSDEGTSEPGTSTTDATPSLCQSPSVPTATVEPNPACDVPLQVGGFDPVVEWKWGASDFCGPAVAGHAVDTNDSGALDPDDLPVVFLYQQKSVVALWGDGSGVAWQAPGNYGEKGGGLALGDLEGDGWTDIVTADAFTVCALDGRDGSQKWCNPDLVDHLEPHGYSFPALADMDGDGSVEVVVGAVILDSKGKQLGIGTPGKGATPWYNDPDPANGYGALSAVVDLDGDGVQEVVTGSAAYDIDGNPIWQNGGADGFVAVADFDLDGEGEIVKTSGTQVIGMESDGAEVWGPINYAGNLGVPAIDDLDGDGAPEIVIGAQLELVALEWGGEQMWVAPISDESGSAGPVLFDFERDGWPEVLYADEVAVRFFSGLDGSLKYFSDKHASTTVFETPIVADVDGDDQVEIVLGHCTADLEIGAITVYGDAAESWPPGRKVWNQHTYHISNVQELGRIPAAYHSNWHDDQRFNSFRSADVGQRPGEFLDLAVEILDVCEADCRADGGFTLAARVRNAGTVDAPAGLAVTLRSGPGGPVVATQTTRDPVLHGTTGEIVTFVALADDLHGEPPVVTVDDGLAGVGTLFECDEQNNSAAWHKPVCAIP